MKHFSQNLLAIFIGLTACAGCRTFPSRPLTPGQETKATLGRAKVTHWLGETKVIDLRGQRDTLAGVLSSTDSLARRAERDSLRRLADKAVQTNQGPSRANDSVKQLQQLAKVIDENVVVLSRRERDWVIPAVLLSDSVIAGLRIADGDSIATRPLHATAFFTPQRQEKTVKVVVAGPLASIRGPVVIRAGSDPTSIAAASVVQDGTKVFTEQQKELRFFRDPSTPANVDAFCETDVADLVVISRLGDDGRIKSLVLPRFPESSPSQLGNNPVGKAIMEFRDKQFSLLSGDVIEFTNSEWAMAQIK